MIRPSRGDQHVYVQKNVHGKSDRISRTNSVVSGGWFSGAAKIIAPVRGQRIRRGLRGAEIGALAFSRRYSDTLIPCFFAWERISRASSLLTLKLIVSIW